ncbi:MAG: 50S ribosomal protein L2 [Candidatus Edwardsbacteria bacterium]|nr:50S ribosomal protein L2 [Candidatus Edwardsbacteria bacterium]MBU1576753.1 50S ribosomal protein L2 [Candidatus Edwardsbacteria bacterium]MBU2463329.1 50S ribosomal protein L2 [Candidatus Edwardsbacteria bacterium]MBU2594780.1 50S ribosomal protein L2 [Candidatus Edwardsbacteria bacterium]
MAIKSYKPTTPGMRHRTGYSFDEITSSKPKKSLLSSLKKSGGRNSHGRVTADHRGGGHKRAYRLIDFKRNKFAIPATVAAIEYDPNRSCRIALLKYADGEWRYIIAPVGLTVGDKILSGSGIDIKVGNCMPLSEIPLGSAIHNIELKKGKGGQMVRTAGGSAQLMAKEAEYAHLRLPSGEVRLVRLECMATLGQVGNLENENISIGKAGRNRWLGVKPHSRGVAKNPHDHPMGGGEGKSSGGRHPCSSKGLLSKGKKTRKKKKTTSKFILKRRK